MNDKDYEALVNSDPLYLAEKLSGKSYKDDKETEGLGFALHLLKNEMLTDAANERDDTTYSCTMEKHLRIAKELGFEIVYTVPFNGLDTKETYHILFHPQTGAVMTCDSYRAKDRNSSKIYFNWIPTDDISWLRYSGHYAEITSSPEIAFKGNQVITEGVNRGERKYCLIGDIDAREGMRYFFTKMVNEGFFIKPWIEQPWLWLLHYEDSKLSNYDYDKINKERISKLPHHVQLSIRGKSSEAKV